MTDIGGDDLRDTVDDEDHGGRDAAAENSKEHSTVDLMCESPKPAMSRGKVTNYYLGGEDVRQARREATSPVIPFYNRDKDSVDVEPGTPRGERRSRSRYRDSPGYTREYRYADNWKRRRMDGIRRASTSWDGTEGAGGNSYQNYVKRYGNDNDSSCFGRGVPPSADERCNLQGQGARYVKLDPSGDCASVKRYWDGSYEDRPNCNDKRSRVNVPGLQCDDAYKKVADNSRLGNYDNTVQSRGRDESDSTYHILEKFMDILKDYKGSGTNRFSAGEVVPDFDPMSKEQTVITWLAKVDECAEIYDWTEREIIHFALPKLKGVARSWYRGLSTVLLTWGEWKQKLIESFPSREDYAELLTGMLAKKVRYGESLERYFYEKVNLLQRCDIKGHRAVDCILSGIDDRAVRVGAQAVQFKEPEEVLRYLKTVKPGNTRESSEKRYDRRNAYAKAYNNSRVSASASREFRCYNCNEMGHKKYTCPEPAKICTNCNRVGHRAAECSIKVNPKGRTTHGNERGKIEKIVSEIKVNDAMSKYIMPVKFEGTELMCHVDLGSEVTVIKECEGKRLGLQTNATNLPSMRGFGGILVKALGKCLVDVTVQNITKKTEVIIVPDDTMKYAAILGHSFTENPEIRITKTADRLIFERINTTRVILKINKETTVGQGKIGVAELIASSEFSGRISVPGKIRGKPGYEYIILPGDYEFHNGVGHVLIYSLGRKTLMLRVGAIIARTITTPQGEIVDVSAIVFDSSTMDSIRCGEQMSQSEHERLRAVLSKYKDCFSAGLKDLGYTTAGEMVIELLNTEPVVYRPYRMALQERKVVSGMVEEMLDAGIVRESSSQYASPIVLVKKKTGEKRLCVDYRALNRRTKKDHYPTPLIEDQLDRLAGNKLFISLDLASGYYQIPIAEASRKKTAFVTPDGQYEFTRMPFGLVNAPSVFQRTINKILSEAKIKYALIYMDDILIPAQDFKQGLERLEEVLGLLRDGGLTLKLEKCCFFCNNIEFLGFEVGTEGIKPGSNKTDAVSKFPTPKSLNELRQFLGLAGFFRKFVRGFAVIAKPLTDLFKKNVAWKWTADQESAFISLKEILTTRPVLALYDPTRETQVHTDACKYGLAGILLQRGDDGLLKPVIYYSRKTTPDEQKFHSFELETLAVIASLNRFRVYLVGIPFKILTDCNALRTTLTKRDLIPRIARWWIQLQEYDCEIEYRKGSGMAHADALSRNATGDAVQESHVLDVLAIGVEDWIVTVQASDEEISKIRDILTNPQSEDVLDVLNNYKLKNGRVYRITGSDGDNLRWVVPKGVRWQIVKMNHDDVGHFGFEKTLSRIQQSFWFPKLRRFVKKYVRSCLECAHYKRPTGKQEGELHPIAKVEIPFHTIHADHVGPFVRSSKGNCYILVIIDGFTKYIHIAPVRNTKSSTTINVFKQFVGFFGTPNRLITDQGTAFTSRNFKAFTKAWNIKHIYNAVSTPRANGQAERFNRTILDSLAAKCHDKNDRSWDEHLTNIQIGLNTTVHKTTTKTPSELLFGFNINNGSENILKDVIADTTAKVSPEDLEEIRTQAGMNIRKKQLKDKAVFDAKRKESCKYSIGDLVSIKRDIPSDGKSKKLAPKYQGPYRVLKELPNERYVIESTPLTRHKNRRYENIVAVDRMKPWLSFEKNFNSSSEVDSNESDSS